MQKLHREVEKAKRTLSSFHEARIEIDDLLNKGETFIEKLTRTKFEELNKDLFLSTLDIIRKVLKDCDKKKSDVDEIILVGGSTHIPKIQQLVKDFFNGKKPIHIANQDELAVYGATVQGGVLSGADQFSDVLVIDINPFTLWIKTTKKHEEIIHRNSQLPYIKSEIYSTAENYQPTMAVQIFEENWDNLLGLFVLTGIPTVALQGQPQIEITFEIDANSILTVYRKSGINSKAILNEHRLTPDNIDNMVQKAKMFDENDKKAKEIVDVKNELEQYAYSLKYLITDKLIEKISEEVESTISWIQSNPDANIDEFKEKNSKLQKFMIDMFTSILYHGNSDYKPKDREEL